MRGARRAESPDCFRIVVAIHAALGAALLTVCQRAASPSGPAAMDSLLLFILIAVLPLLPWIAGFWIVRHGPWPNRFWKHETVAGFATTVTVAAACVGFFIGVAFLGQFGPPIGVLASLPPGIFLGLVWGMQRARRS